MRITHPMATAMPGKRKMQRPVLAAAVGLGCVLALIFGTGRHYVSLSWDPHEVNCLPELHLALLVHSSPKQVGRHQYVFWRPSGALSYVKEDFALKRVAGVPGDRLTVRDETVYINGEVVARGLDNAVLYDKGPADFERSEIIPADRFFVIGTASMSNDSRYWGYLPKSEIAGIAYRVY
jgi:conjugal transfer pilin signal peptidase TrbI